MLNTLFEFLLWGVIGALPGFYVFYVRGYDTRLGSVLGAILGVVVGIGGLQLGLVGGPLSAAVIIFGLLCAALLLMPPNEYAEEITLQRRLMTGLGGILIVLFLMVGLSDLTIASFKVPAGVFTIGALIAFVFVLPRGSYQRTQTRGQRITNLAYALMLPTILIVVGIVVFPVIWNVIFSVREIETRDLPTADLFDLSEVSLANFQAQVGLRFDSVPCVPAEEGEGCAVDEDGNTEYFDPRRYEEIDDYRGWREIAGFNRGDTRLAIGARNPDFYPMLFRTMGYTLASTIAAIVFGLVAALIVRDNFPGRTVFRAFILFPYIAPVISVAFVWQILLRQSGLINGLAGTNIDFLGTRDTFLGISIPLLVVILFQTWRYFPFAFLFLLARIQAIPEEMYEAAKVDGATPISRLWFITFPQLRAVVGTLFLLRFIWTFNKFDDIFLLTGEIKQTKVIPIQIFDSLFNESNVGEASAVAVIMAAILAVILLIYFRFFLVDEVE